MRLQPYMQSACQCGYRTYMTGSRAFLNIGAALGRNVANLEFENLKQLIDKVWNNRETISRQLEENNLLKRKPENAEIAVNFFKNKFIGSVAKLLKKEHGTRTWGRFP